MAWFKLTEEELDDLSQGDAELLKTLIEGDDLLGELHEQVKEGDIDDILAACRDLINWHMKDVDKFMKEGKFYENK